MSQRTLPLLFFNLGGEMLYILHQRLHAQKVLPTKASKVMQEMVQTMFSEPFLEELFRPQGLFSREGLKVLFLKVAHSSIMRLNDVAMEKLFDLMSMGFKYQLIVCPRPEDIIIITLNHLDSIKEFVSNSEPCRVMVNAASRKMNEHYSSLSKADFIALRATMLSLLQDTHKRISVLMKKHLQNQNGWFVLPVGGPVPVGVEIPGTVRYYSEAGDISSTEHFKCAHQFSPAEKQGSWEVVGNRVTKLGCNIYPLESSSSSQSKQRKTMSEAALTEPATRRRGERARVKVQPKLEEEEEEREPVERGGGSHATVELSLLHRLLAAPQGGRETTFRLNPFPQLEDDSSEDEANPTGEASSAKRAAKSNDSVLRLELSKRGSDELSKIREEFTVVDDAGSDEGDDLLDLMDQALA